MSKLNCKSNKQSLVHSINIKMGSLSSQRQNFPYGSCSLFFSHANNCHNLGPRSSQHDPGIIFCIIDRIAIYGGGYVHRLASTANAVMRSTFVCNANNMLDPKAKRKFISQVFWKTFCLISVTMLMLLVALIIPGQEKLSQSWSNCQRTPEITRYNFQDFYMPHEKSKYDFLVFSLTILPMTFTYFISILMELHHVVKTHQGMRKYLDGNLAVPISARLRRRQKNVFSFRCSILLAITDMLTFCALIIGKETDGIIRI